MSEPLSERYRLAAVRRAELDCAASLLEESKSAVLAQRMAALGDMPVNRAEMTVKGSREWADYIKSMVEARRAEALARVDCEYIRMLFHEQNSAEATARAEMRLS